MNHINFIHGTKARNYAAARSWYRRSLMCFTILTFIIFCISWYNHQQSMLTDATMAFTSDRLHAYKKKAAHHAPTQTKSLPDKRMNATSLLAEQEKVLSLISAMQLLSATTSLHSCKTDGRTAEIIISCKKPRQAFAVAAQLRTTLPDATVTQVQLIGTQQDCHYKATIISNLISSK